MVQEIQKLSLKIDDRNLADGTYQSGYDHQSTQPPLPPRQPPPQRPPLQQPPLYYFGSRLQGIPGFIILDQDSKFLATSWTTL